MTKALDAALEAVSKIGKPDVVKPLKFTRKKFWYPGGRIEWAVSSEYGSLSFWADPTSVGGDNYYGGVESHYNEKSKPEYRTDPDHVECQINGGKCWHDGTSLWASEYWIPHILPKGDDYIFARLEEFYEGCMKPVVEGQ